MAPLHRKQVGVSRRPVLLLVMLAVLLSVVTAGGWLFTQKGDSHPVPDVVSTDTASVDQPSLISIPPSAPEQTPSIVPQPTTAIAEQPIPAKAEPIRIIVPSAHIDTSVSLLPVSDEQRRKRDVVPPNEPTAYWTDISPFDMPGRDSKDMTFILAHACAGLSICETVDWQFSRLSDPNLVKAGDGITVVTTNGNVCYRVDVGPTVHDKNTIAKEDDVFGTMPLPKRLVLASCYTADVHGKRVIVVAGMIPCGN